MSKWSKMAIHVVLQQQLREMGKINVWRYSSLYFPKSIFVKARNLSVANPNFEFLCKMKSAYVIHVLYRA